jgi:hypothetical protein
MQVLSRSLDAQRTACDEGRGRFLLPALVGLLVAALAYQVSTPLVVDLGAPGDARSISGFSWPEEVGGSTVRWSGAHAEVVFPLVGNQPYLLTLRVSGLRPAGNPEATIAVNGRTVIKQLVSGDMSSYTAVIDRSTVGLWGSVVVALDSETFSPSKDRGELGLMVDSARLEPVGGLNPVVPPPFVWALSGLLAASLTVFAEKRWGRRAAVGALAAASILLTVGLTVYRQPVTTYLTAALVASLALVLLWRFFLGRLPVWERFAVAALAGALAYYAYFSIIIYNSATAFADFQVFANAAKSLVAGLPIYDFVQAHNDPNSPVYKHPPLFAILLAPFARLELTVFAQTWFLVNQVLYGLTLVLLMRGFEIGWRSPSFYILGVASLLHRPVLESLWRGQPDFVILASLAIAFLLLRKTHGFAAGVALALATMLKLYPGLLIVYFVLQRRWRGIVGLALGCGLLLAISVATVGWETHVRYVSEILLIQNAAVPYPENQSYSGFVSRLVVPPEQIDWYTTVPMPLAPGLLVLALDAASLALTGWVLLRGKPTDRLPRMGLQFASLIPLMILMWPTGWIHYQTILILPLFALVCYLRREDRLVLGLTVVGFALTAFGNEKPVLDPSFFYGVPGLLRSYKTLGIVLLWAALLRAQSRESADSPTELCAAGSGPNHES